MNNSRNKKMTIVLGIFVVFLLMIALYMAYFQLAKASFYNSHDFNSRNWVDESQVLRGTIRDKNGNSLAYTKRDSKGRSIRINNFNYMYSSIIGYSSKEFGKTGIEQHYNKELLNIRTGSDFISQIEDIYKKSETGQDVYLTIDSDIQAYMFSILKGYKGAIVVIEPKTGNILSMVSRPTFNVNNLKEEWESLTSSEDGVLINRATQGLYTPGSIFKVISSVVFLEKEIDLNYTDKGNTVINGYKINNYREKVYGDITLREALMYSSNTYFSDKSKEVDNLDYLTVTRRLMLGEKYDFDLPRNLSRIPFNKNLNDLEKAVTAFGQGDSMVTPLDMANIAAAIANDGVMMKPKVVNKTKLGDKESIVPDEILSKAISPEINNKLVEYLSDTAVEHNLVLEDGTILAGKTGTAETGTSTNLWYMGFGPSKNAKYAIALVLEDTDLTNGHVGAQLAKQAMNYLLNR